MEEHLKLKESLKKKQRQKNFQKKLSKLNLEE